MDVGQDVSAWSLASLRRVIVALVAVVGALLSAASAAPPDIAGNVRAAEDWLQLSGISYDIVATMVENDACGVARTFPATFGVPTPLHLTGSSTPDLTVTLVPAGAGGTEAFHVTVARPTVASPPLPVRLEAVVAPGTDTNRLAFGYDACESTAPVHFQATAVAQPEKISVDADITGAGPSLKLIGSGFTADGDQRRDPTVVTARLEPVPSSALVTVDALADSSYRAHAEVSTPTVLDVDYDKTAGSDAVAATVHVERLPDTFDATFSRTKLVWDAPDDGPEIAKVDVDADIIAQGEPSKRVSVHLEGVPTDVTVDKDGPKHVTITAPNSVDAATVRYATFDPGETLPAPPARTTAYVDTLSRPGVEVADVRALGLRSLVAEWGDVVGLDVTHAGGPFDVSVVNPDRTVIATIRDLPADIDLDYDTSTHVLTYRGSAVIDSLTVDVTSRAPIAGRANRLRLATLGVPSGFTATLDRDNKKFNLTLAEGTRLGSAELALTNGALPQLPAGTDGLLLSDPADPTEPIPPSAPYAVMLRLSQVASADVSWATPAAVTLIHDEAPFHVSLTTFERTVTARLANLPADTRFTYDTVSSTLTYRGSDDIDLVTVDVVPNEPDAKRVHLVASGVPTELTLTNDTVAERISGDMPAGDLDLLEVLVTTDVGSCSIENCLPAGVTGVRVKDWKNPLSYLAFARIPGITHADVSFADPLSLQLDWRGGPVHIKLVKQVFGGEFGEHWGTQSVVGDILNLPASVTFTYSPVTDQMGYRGSGEIAELHLRTVNDLLALPGRPRRVLLDVFGIPTELDVGYTNNGRLLAVTIDAPTGKLHKLELLHTNVPDEEIGPGDRLPDDKDGALLQTRGEDDADKINFIRARGVHSFHLVRERVDDPEDNPYHGDRVSTFVDASLIERRDIVVEKRYHDEHEAYGNGYSRIEYFQPPQTMHLALAENEFPNGDVAYRTITYNASSQGAKLQYMTNEGEDRSIMDAYLEPVPTVVQGCISPDRAICSKYESLDLGPSPQSYSLTVSEPTSFHLFDCIEPIIFHYCKGEPLPSFPYVGDELKVTMTVHEHLTVLKQDREEDDKDAYIHVDTRNSALAGEVRGTRWSNGIPGTHNRLLVTFPEGFRAHDRFMWIDCDKSERDCDGEKVGEYPMGTVNCPRGTHIRTLQRSPIGYVDVADEFCDEPRLEQITPSELPQGTTDAVVEIRGEGFSQGADVGFFQGAFSPLGEMDPTIHVHQVDWVSESLLRVHLSIDATSPIDSRGIVVTNALCAEVSCQIDDALGYCEDCFRVTEARPPVPMCDGRSATVVGAGHIEGTAGDDVIVGSEGADVINGLGGNDVMCALGGDDALLTGATPDGADTMFGGDGTDTVSYADRVGSVTVSVGGTAPDGESGEGDVVHGDVETVIGGSNRDFLEGSAESSVPVRLEGRGGRDVLSGTAADDALLGGDDHDQIRGGPGNDTLEGEAGDDVLSGEALPNGADVLSGGQGFDVATYARRAESVQLSLDGVANDGSADEGDNLVSVERLFSGSGDDTVVGDGGANRLDGGPGTDQLFGGAGDDALEAASSADGADLFAGGEGTDSALYVARSQRVELSLDGIANDGAAGEGDNLMDIEQLYGGAGTDRLVGDAGNNLLDGGGGDDEQLGGAGDDTLAGGATGNGADLLSGGNGVDRAIYPNRSEPLDLSLDGVANDGAASERDNLIAIEGLQGGAGADRLTGDAGSNLLDGGRGDDELLGAAGNDTLAGGATGNGADLLSGGEGVDRAIYTSRTEALELSLDGVANDGATGEGDNLTGIEDVYGGAGADRIVGDGANNVLVGGRGDDRITGGAGNDSASGDDGNDTIDIADGVSGNDSADGGAGTDTATADAGDRLSNIP